MKTLAVIILNWNGYELLKQFIPAASRFTVSDEADLIVADNGSTDDSLTWLRKNHPEVKVIALDRNYGFAEGYNRAIKATGYPFTILLNSDVEVTEGWWQPLLRFMKKNPDVGAIQPKIKSFRNKQCFEYAGAPAAISTASATPIAAEGCSSVWKKTMANMTARQPTYAGPRARL